MSEMRRRVKCIRIARTVRTYDIIDVLDGRLLAVRQQSDDADVLLFIRYESVVCRAASNVVDIHVE